MAGYTRVDTSNNIADGNVISAADLDNEFDGIQAAFNASTGHNHDGTTGEGAPILVLGPTQDVVVGASTVTPKTTNTVDIGSSSLKFKDLYLAGNASIGGTLGVTGVATLGNGAVLGTPASVTLTNGTGLPIATGVSGLGTGVATALAVNVGSAGAPVINGGALGTPSSGTVTNLTGTASININGTVGATTASTGAFTTLTTSSTVTHNGGTANSVCFLNGSKVLTTGSALTFDGSTFGVKGSGQIAAIESTGNYSSSGAGFIRFKDSTGNRGYIGFGGTSNLMTVSNTVASAALNFELAGTERMRLTSTGLGIGTSSPSGLLHLAGNTAATTAPSIVLQDTGTTATRLGSLTNDNGDLVLAMTASLTDLRSAITLFDDRNISFTTNASERMRINSSGNVGIGTSSPKTKLNVIGDAAIGSTNAAMMEVTSSGIPYFSIAADASNYRSTRLNVISSGGYADLSFERVGTTARTGLPSAGTPDTASPLLYLDASAGNVGIGTSSPTSKLSLGGNMDFQQSSNLTTTTGYLNITPSSTLILDTGDTVQFRTSGTERARIDSSGSLCIGNSGNFGAKVNIAFEPASTNGLLFAVSSGTFTNNYIYFQNSGGSKIGSVSSDNSSVTYNTTSDYRVKQNIQPLQNALTKVMALNPVTYDWKPEFADGGSEGFIAHELAEVCPQAVTGAKDAVDAEGNPQYQGIDTSFLVVTLTAAIQEQQAIIESLRQRLAAAGI